MGLTLQHLLRYADEGEDMLNRIVTGDKSWVHHYIALMQWKHTSSPSAKKCNVMPSTGEVMLIMFWDSRGILLAYFQKHGGNMNAALYCEVLLKLWNAVHRKHPSQLVKGVLLNHDNARPHTAQVTQERIQELQWELSEHPPYNPDLASSDFHLFGPLKIHHGGKCFMIMKRLKRRSRSG
jgi:histone-lysine N-methyltransferase SETMAR